MFRTFLTNAYVNGSKVRGSDLQFLFALCGLSIPFRQDYLCCVHYGYSNGFAQFLAMGSHRVYASLMFSSYYYYYYFGSFYYNGSTFSCLRVAYFLSTCYSLGTMVFSSFGVGSWWFASDHSIRPVMFRGTFPALFYTGTVERALLVFST